ncbi:LOB domain-containing protein 11 [Hibiscus syriacus]|uniref:LOB domain-containing protein 11 n=1 Tax=Hibiscus syriacus TaxID=106335 RepID=A0A6A2WM91_HIBSY|nr:LOB domain-containing protein 1-like [Hibiscus syriacus]KAE8660341.1 LOB domain-containing protein 11 [Hibiscus syriacus]
MFKMEHSETTPVGTPNSLNSLSPSLSPPLTSNLTSPPVVISPCAACKILRRRCTDKCVLAPYFPPTEPAKFTIAHRVFGASNIIKFLQELPEFQRADAVSSMVYEASARIRDPVYGCAGAICQLQKQVNELQAQLAKAQAEVVNLQFQQANLVGALLCMEVAQSPQLNPEQSVDENTVIGGLQSFHNNPNFMEDNLWEPLWT